MNILQTSPFYFYMKASSFSSAIRMPLRDFSESQMQISIWIWITSQKKEVDWNRNLIWSIIWTNGKIQIAAANLGWSYLAVCPAMWKVMRLSHCHSTHHLLSTSFSRFFRSIISEVARCLRFCISYFFSLLVLACFTFHILLFPTPGPYHIISSIFHLNYSLLESVWISA